MIQETIHKITTEGDVEGRTTRTIGYFTGDINDILAYCEKNKSYTLGHTEIFVRHISPDSIIERKKLEDEIANLKLKLKTLESQL